MTADPFGFVGKEFCKRGGRDRKLMCKNHVVDPRQTSCVGKRANVCMPLALRPRSKAGGQER
ncbi:hypothetical protein BOTNAR_0168g00070 [Botryotinia narcissicola]|uniref:Uncharacterized protein n=1 Tax=Botryotinia narcissicola TaxID=278944 RepID=A0A4Z1IQV0_9HELO|nr:hypothetical protein BOTNAR_0168g00070 [Botryotinia narcissicola]